MRGQLQYYHFTATLAMSATVYLLRNYLRTTYIAMR